MSIEKLAHILRNAKRIVFFGGAGVSTESGIPDFRGNNGLYQTDSSFDEEPETILSHGYLYTHPETFYTYYRRHMVYPDARPNGAHKALYELEKCGKLTAVITQNIDGLHQLAGNQRVIELHGSIRRNYCTRCGREYPLSFIMKEQGVPHCESCGGFIRPDVVMYGESLDENAMDQAVEAIEAADVMIVGGTSLTVQPAASFVSFFRGSSLVILNQSPTPYDRYAQLVIREPIGQVLSAAVAAALDH